MPGRDPPDNDPLDAVLRPPIDETPEEKSFRLAAEAEAHRISQEIDESIRQEKLQKKKMRVVRLLLLGQSESGREVYNSTTVPATIHALGIPRRAYSLARHHPAQPPALRPHHPRRARRRPRTRAPRPPATRTRPRARIRPPPTLPPAAPSTRSRRTTLHSDSASDPDSDSASLPLHHPPSALLPAHLHALRARLVPLQHAEARLIAALVPPSEDAPYLPAQLCGGYGSPGRGVRARHARADSDAAGEVFVRPGAAWKRAVRPEGRGCGPGVSGGRELAEEAQALLVACRADLMALWRDNTARTVLKRRKIRLEESPGFFLDDLDRVTQPHYQPSDDDVLKARLKTVGVSEYRFEMEAGSEQGTQWRIIDVGGSRSQKETWVPFFDDAIIFLAPISGFDQTLAEDKSVNRLEDSVLLWKAVCANKLLARVNLVLFLNKCDILAAKLASGVRLAKYVRSFGERANDSETAEKYFRSKFNAIHREYSPIPRKFYGFCTSVTDTKTTGGIIASVRDMVVREHLRASKLL
ncbi:hypothetical protein IEO21_09402 [Rhodonia placenta]|uniref:Candidate G-protein alpha subunit n=1 Tax=Rhodonia placenta TaxID=104341 RepID=A0A8H7NUF9_9APHY|nr:hypothetical protein IEO21_09402 [Postia placenta]